MFPIEGILTPNGFDYMDPENHEGVDLFVQSNGSDPFFQTQQPIKLIANGECLFFGQGKGIHDGKIALFRHRQPNSAEIISAYGHLDKIRNLEIGKVYQVGTEIGKIENSGKNGQQFLHFAIAYGASWDAVLRRTPNVPLNVGPTWIRNHYLSPMDYLHTMCNQNLRHPPSEII
jgi:hypothetical protein